MILGETLGQMLVVMRGITFRSRTITGSAMLGIKRGDMRGEMLGLIVHFEHIQRNL